MTADDWMKEENEIRSHIAINRFLKKRRRKKKEEVLMKSHVFNHEIEGHKHLLSGFLLLIIFWSILFQSLPSSPFYYFTKDPHISLLNLDPW